VPADTCRRAEPTPFPSPRSLEIDPRDGQHFRAIGRCRGRARRGAPGSPARRPGPVPTSSRSARFGRGDRMSTSAPSNLAFVDRRAMRKAVPLGGILTEEYALGEIGALPLDRASAAGDRERSSDRCHRTPPQAGRGECACRARLAQAIKHPASPHESGRRRPASHNSFRWRGHPRLASARGSASAH